MEVMQQDILLLTLFRLPQRVEIVGGGLVNCSEELMLASSKPLAIFSDARISLSDKLIFPVKAFVPYVKSGTYVRDEFELMP